MPRFIVPPACDAYPQGQQFNDGQRWGVAVDDSQARQTWKWALDRLIARPRSAHRFDLLDAEGKYVGSALSMAHAERFAADIGATVELADPSGGVSRRWAF